MTVRIKMAIFLLILLFMFISSINQVLASEVTDRPLESFTTVCTPELSFQFTYDIFNKNWSVKGYKQRKFTITKLHIPFDLDEAEALQYLNNRYGESPVFARCASGHAFGKSNRERHDEIIPGNPYKSWFSTCIKVDDMERSYLYKYNPYRVCKEIAFEDGDAAINCSDSVPSFELGINGHFRHTFVSYDEVILELGNCTGTAKLNGK